MDTDTKQFVLDLLEWRKSVALVVIVLLLGWPSMVILNMGQDLGYWGSFNKREQTSRQEEHRRQTKLLEKMTNHLADINEALTHHNDQSLRKDAIIAYLLSEDCEKEPSTQSERNRCERLQRFVDDYNKRDHH